MSLAVKYRPKHFHEVLGQEEVVKQVQRILKRKPSEWPHAWLLTGPSGCGKTTIARLLAADFCGHEVGIGNIIDVDAATNSGAEDMRATASSAQFKAIGASPVKVYIIDEAHNLSQKAWDSLLLPSEEPPDHVFWVLCTTNPAKVPRTIQTRCVKFALAAVPEITLMELLFDIAGKEGFEVSDEIVELLADEAKGSPRDALSLLETCAGAKTLAEAKRLLQSAANDKDIVELAKLVLGKQTINWPQVTKIIDGVKEKIDPESARIVITNYIGGALLKAKSNNEAQRMLFLLDCFSGPYQASDRWAPLLLSVGRAMGLDQ